MCTVTFWPRRQGYALAMNRDENLARVTGLPPHTFSLGHRKAMGPSEPGGGTWISLNDRGACLALINWYSITRRAPGRPVSRGTVVAATRWADDPVAANGILVDLPLRQLNPFRLLGFFPAGRQIIEWRWDLQKLSRHFHRWAGQQWVSSGFDETMAQQIRGKTFRAARSQKTAGRLDWLRRLHRSHSPQTGPFSTCMHRADAATVSYTEVLVQRADQSMNYHAGPPCERKELFACRF